MMEQASPARGVSSQVGLEGIREEKFMHVVDRGTVNFLNCSARPSICHDSLLVARSPRWGVPGR